MYYFFWIFDSGNMLEKMKERLLRRNIGLVSLLWKILFELLVFLFFSVWGNKKYLSVTDNEICLQMGLSSTWAKWVFSNLKVISLSICNRKFLSSGKTQTLAQRRLIISCGCVTVLILRLCQQEGRLETKCNWKNCTSRSVSSCL